MNVATLPDLLVRRADWVIVGLGVLFRVAQYASDRPYWLDEGSLAENILPTSRGGILDPLRNGQLAPPGFLAAERIAFAVLGGTRLALRLIPLLSGITSVVLFLQLSRITLRPTAALIALGLFAVSDDLIAYSAELKQYETDVAVGLACTLLGLWSASRPATAARSLGVAAAGAAAVWVSHPSAFVLAGAGTVLLASSAGRRDWGRFAALAAVCGAWALSFAAVHAAAMNQLGHRGDMWVFWDFAFPPVHPATAWDLSWPLRRTLYVFVNPLDFHSPLGYRASAVPALGFFAVGLVTMWGRDRASWGVLVAPVLFTLLAASLHLYPFHGRLVLFLVPSFLLMIAAGAGRIGERFRRRAVWAAVLGSILLFPALRAAYHLETPRKRDDFNPHGDRRPGGLDPGRFPF